jgi:hypothetical protein
LAVRDHNGLLVAERRAPNSVLRQGAELVAKLFAGQATTPIDAVRVGFGTEPLAADETALRPPPTPVDAGALTSPVAPGDCTVSTDRDDLVQVAITAAFTPIAPLTDVTEAGLAGGDVLYNQVLFDPVTLRPGQAVTFFWEIDFPFGH